MARFSIVTTTYNEYELTRQLVESVLCNIDKNTYDKFFIADDFSKMNSKLREYLTYLNNTYDNIEVLMHDEERNSMYNTNGTSYGPIVNLARAVYKVDTEFSLNIDNDTLFLKKSKNVLNEMASYFDKFPDVAIMGQMMGQKPSYYIEKDAGKIYFSNSLKYGSPSPMANAVRMSLLKERGMDYVPEGHPMDRSTRAGWNHTHLLSSIYRAGLHVLNFPLFSELYMFHLGGGIVDLQVDGRKIRKFAYCTDFQGRYGGKGNNTIIDWYSGRLIVNMTHDEYVNYLRKEYNRPFEDIRPINEIIFKKID